jgi:hypothetical protein
MENDLGGTTVKAKQSKFRYFPPLRAYASIRSGGGKLSAGPVTEFTMIEPTPLNRETDAASASALLHR